MRNAGRILSFLFVMLAAAGPALAAHPLITDDTGTQGKGRFQLELNGEVSRDKETLDGVNTREDAGEAAAVFSIGTTDNVDIVVSLPWVWSRLKEVGALVADEAGPGDVGLEVKWRFLARGGFSLALKPGITLPTGDEEKGGWKRQGLVQPGLDRRVGVGAVLHFRQRGLHPQRVPARYRQGDEPPRHLAPLSSTTGTP